MNKLVFKIGTAAYFILAIMAIFFYLERTAFLDISFHLFYILKDGDFAIQNNRFGSCITQLFPLIGSKLSLDLSTIMKLYSVGFVLYYYSIFFVCTKILKSYKFGLAMLLLSTLMVSDTFYWIQSELPQGLALLILYFALLDYIPNIKKSIQWIIISIMAILNLALVFFHPLLIFPFLFCTIFLYLNNSSLRSHLKSSTLLFFMTLIIKSLFFSTTYDSSSMGGIRNFITLFPDYIFLESNKNFLLSSIQDYYMLVLMLVGLAIYYLKTNQHLKLLLIAVFFIGYTLLVNVSFPEGANQFYLENLYLPLSIFAIIPFVLDITLSKKHLYALLLSLLLGIKLVHIGMNHQSYTDRVNYLNDYLVQTESLPQKKMILSEKNFDVNILQMTWASPYEFWLLSTINNNETRSVLITKDIEKLKWTSEHNKTFVTKWGAFDYSDLPEKYFILKDTSLYKFKN